ncbi:MAG: hypothetical protein SNJ67_05395 [Chloracidobacterium sp.]
MSCQIPWAVAKLEGNANQVMPNHGIEACSLEQGGHKMPEQCSCGAITAGHLGGVPQWQTTIGE